MCIRTFAIIFKFGMYVIIIIIYFFTTAAASTVSSCSCSTVTVNCLSQMSSITTPVTKLPSMEYSQHSILSQLSSYAAIVSDTHSTFSCSPVTVVECSTTSSSVVTSISGPLISVVTTAAGT